MWEIFNDGIIPYPGMSNKEVITYVLDGHQLEKPSKCPQEVYELMLKCWQIEPNQRPSFVDLNHSLKQIAQLCATSQPQNIDSVQPTPPHLYLIPEE